MKKILSLGLGVFGWRRHERGMFCGLFDDVIGRSNEAIFWFKFSRF